MLRNYLVVAVRNLMRHKLYSAINVTGLSIGLGCFLVAWLYFQHEMGYDAFHPDAGRIKLVYSINKTPSGERVSLRTPNALPGVLAENYSHLGEIAQVYETSPLWVERGDVAIKEGVALVTASYFALFNLRAAKGNPKSVVEEQSGLILTESVSRRLFHAQDPMGETVTIGGHDYFVGAILRDPPTNSRVGFSVILPYARFSDLVGEDQKRAWHSFGTHTYVKLGPGVDGRDLDDSVGAIGERSLPPFMKGRVRFRSCPLREVHVATELGGVSAPGVSVGYLYALLGAAALVLAIACMNFTNLAAARYGERELEVGVRKALGAGRKRLVGQFLGESVVVGLISLSVAIALVELYLPAFNRILGVKLATEWTAGATATWVLLGIGIGALAGSYPAVIASRLVAPGALKASGSSTRRKALQAGLVILQFAAGITLVMCELMIMRQVAFLRDHDLGFKPEHLVAIPLTGYKVPQAEQLAEGYVRRLEAAGAEAGIVSACVSEHVPGTRYRNRFGTIPEGWSRDDATEMLVTSIDDRFIDTYGLALTEGRNFSRDRGTDPAGSVLLNAHAAEMIGWDTAVDREIRFVHGEGPYRVVGVVDDIHYESLKQTVKPLVYRFVNGPGRVGFITVGVMPGQLPSALEVLKREWGAVLPNIRFESRLVEDGYLESYGSEAKTASLIGGATALAILLACLGLVGLTAVTTAQRRREIGIRKALGATVAGILTLLSRELVVMATVANVIAWPVAYVVIGRWLQDFPYKADIGLDLFVMGGALALLLALTSVGYHAMRAAMANPVDALRYE